MKGAPNARFLWVILAAAIVVGLLLLLPMMVSSSNQIESGPDVVPETVTDTSPEGSGSLADRTSTFSMGPAAVFSLVWRLGLVGIIVAAAVIGLRWWGKKTSGPASSTGFLRVVDTLAISNGRTLHLVALGNRVITIGATTQHISFLGDLTPDESAELLSQAAETSPSSFAGFADELMRSLRRGSSSGSSTDTPSRNARSAVIGEETP